MPRGSERSSERAASMKVGLMSMPTSRAPAARTSRVLWPSPHPRSSPARPFTSGSMVRNAGVFTRSRTRSYPARDSSTHARERGVEVGERDGANDGLRRRGGAELPDRTHVGNPCQVAHRWNLAERFVLGGDVVDVVQVVGTPKDEQPGRPRRLVKELSHS